MKIYVNLHIKLGESRGEVWRAVHCRGFVYPRGDRSQSPITATQKWSYRRSCRWKPQRRLCTPKSFRIFFAKDWVTNVDAALHFPFNFISGSWLQIPDLVWSHQSLHRAAVTSHEPTFSIPLQLSILLTLQPVHVLSAPLSCPAECLPCVTPQRERVTWISRLHILAWSVLLGANTHQSLLLGFPLLCDCSNLQVMLYNPVIPELLQGILSHKSLSNSRFCSFSSFSLPLSPTTPFPFLWFLSSLSCFYRKPQPNPSRGFIIHSAISALFPGKLGLVFSLSILSKYLIASQLQIWRKPLNFSLSLHCPVACQNNLKKKWLYEIGSLHYWNPDWPVQLSRG